MSSRVKKLAQAVAGFAFFTMMTGYGSCQGSAGYSNPGGSIEVGYESGYPTSGGYAPSSGSGYAPAPAPLDPIYDVGDIALTVYAPWDGLTSSFDVTLRDGGTYGDIVLQGTDFVFDGSGVAAVDITYLPFGYYDLEVVGLDVYGNSVSYAAAGVTLQEALTTVTLSLEPSTVAGDVVLDVLEPDGGLYGNPTTELDYTLWEVDAAGGQYVFVEALTVAFDPWSPPIIGNLELGEFYIEVRAFDAWGIEQYEFAGSFSHNSETTTVPIDLWYVQ